LTIKTMLKVINVQEVPGAACIVDIDSYVPISFRSCHQLIAGARYVRLGNFKTQLLELQCPPESLTLSGFTLLLGEPSVEGFLTGKGPSTAGLPEISLDQGAIFAGRIPRLDIPMNVAVACANGEAEIRLGRAAEFNRKIVFGRVEFLLSDDLLVGLRVLDLTEKETQILCDYLAQRRNQ
jgi:hypothetical protein